MAFSFSSAPIKDPKDLEITQPPLDTVTCLQFNPTADILASSSWDSLVRVWEIQPTGTSVPKAEQKLEKPVLSCCWHADGTKLFTAGSDNKGHIWDLQSNQIVQCAQHDAPIKTVHYIKCPKYECLMTGSWDKSLKFWDTRQATPIKTFQTGEKVYCADVLYPMAVVSTAQTGLLVYQLSNGPEEFKKMDSPLKYQHRCLAIFKDKETGISPVGFALGSVEGRVAIQYVNTKDHAKDNFTFKCHRSEISSTSTQDVYAVNDVAFHPQKHGHLATVGSDGKYSFWDKGAKTKLKTSEAFPSPISAATFNASGKIFAYAIGYDWTKGHEYNNPAQKPSIRLRSCTEDLESKKKK